MLGLVFEIHTVSYLYRDTSRCLCLDAEGRLCAKLTWTGSGGMNPLAKVRIDSVGRGNMINAQGKEMTQEWQRT